MKALAGHRILLVLALGPLAVLMNACPGDRNTETDRIASLLTSRYEHKMISSGKNFPAVRMQDENRGDLAVLLHAGVPLGEIRQHFGWSEIDMQGRLDELQEAGLVKRTQDGTYVPTLMVMSIRDVDLYLGVPDSLVEEAAALIVDHLPLIRRRYEDVEGLRRVPFDSASLLILSDVLLDNWQIRRIEEQFLGSERPLRAGSRYYYSMQETAPGDSVEAFGIYGNQYRGFGICTVGVYGNRRANNPRNFLTLAVDDVQRLFGTRPDSLLPFQQDVLGQLVEAARDSDFAAASPYARGWEALGWREDGKIVVPVLDREDRALLSGLAQLVTEELLNLLESFRAEITRSYSTSPFGAEVTFQEYFIWWYHLFYTAVTDRLVAGDYITVPAVGIVTYVMVAGE